MSITLKNSQKRSERFTNHSESMAFLAALVINFAQKLIKMEFDDTCGFFIVFLLILSVGILFAFLLVGHPIEFVDIIGFFIILLVEYLLSFLLGSRFLSILIYFNLLAYLLLFLFEYSISRVRILRNFV